MYNYTNTYRKSYITLFDIMELEKEFSLLLNRDVDIVDCILDINEFTEKMGFYEFGKDKMCKLAVER